MEHDRTNERAKAALAMLSPPPAVPADKPDKRVKAKDAKMTVRDTASPEADFQSHYDLGVAFKEMGLLDEAIAEFQKALRAPEGKLRTSEALGVCFFAKGAFGVAESILRRGLELPASGDQERLGVLYWLGRSLEDQGRNAEAKELYGRVFAVDIRFMDVSGRVKALAKVK